MQMATLRVSAKMAILESFASTLTLAELHHVTMEEVVP
jgi:hypothetical protein